LPTACEAPERNQEIKLGSYFTSTTHACLFVNQTFKKRSHFITSAAECILSPNFLIILSSYEEQIISICLLEAQT
jgi:hypothetical protein